jgi:hypothetical protein
MVVFVLDYLLRVLTVHAVPQRLIYWDGRKVHEKAYGDPQPSGLRKTFAYMSHINQIVDLLVIIPFIFHAFFRGFVQLRLLRVTRVLRVRCVASSRSRVVSACVSVLCVCVVCVCVCVPFPSHPPTLANKTHTTTNA